MAKQERNLIKLISLVFASFIFFLFLAGGSAQNASAATSSYSDVLHDLGQDENFTVTDYPATSGDYSLHVIQIAESSDGELLIYVYQPAGRQDIKACSINIAREINNSVGLGFKNYELEYLNSNGGVFFKYRVKDFELKADTVRYYNVSNILRPWDKIIDNPAGGGQTISEVPYPVGQFWTACTVGDSVTYTMTESEVITVTEKYVGHVIYDEGVQLGWTTTHNKTAAHFVAFATDKPIEKLISASVTFNERDVQYKLCGNLAHTDALNGHTYKSKFDYIYGDKTPHDTVKLSYKDKVFDIGKNNYTWDRIRTTDDFLADGKNEDREITSGDEASLAGTKWVLNFYETPLQAKTDGKEWAVVASGWAALFNGVGDIDCRYTEVSDVMILQLEFETDGQHYNLGVVDNKQTGSNKPWGGNGNKGSGCTADWGWLSALPVWAWFIIFPLGIAAAIVLVCLVVWLVKLPFRKLSEHRKRKRIEREILLNQEARDNAKAKATQKRRTTARQKRKGGKK